MKKLSLFLLATVALGACKKDSENTPTTSKTDLLTSHNWKPSAGTFSITAGGQTISNDAFDSCEKDDVYKFGTDKSLVVDAGTTKCDPSDPQKETGTWAFTSNEQKMTISMPGQSVPVSDLDIKELSAKTLHITATQSANGGSYSIDMTFVAQ
jgi:hypothetical protein